MFLVKLTWQPFGLELAHRWTIASGLGPGGGGGTDVFDVMVVELRDPDGMVGTGESAPSSRYGETVESTRAFLERVDPARLSFSDVPGSMAYLETVAPNNFAPKGALNIALLDGAARQAHQPIHSWLGLDFVEDQHRTSFSIGLDRPEVIRQKTMEAASYPILKLKVGSPLDRENLAALRSAAPTKTVRADANEAWQTREEALRRLEWLAEDGNIELVEQPMPATASVKDLHWLKARSPLPLMADESFLCAHDAYRCAEGFHSVNVKLVKTGGISGAFEALQAARRLGLKTMIGCMIESSILITAAAHLAALADYLDLDGNLLVTNDPFMGVTAEGGLISFRHAEELIGLRVRPRLASD